jgi:amino acid permease
MIQRIQTVYLLLVAGFFIALLFLPLAFIQSDGSAYALTLCTVKSISETTKTVFLTYPLAITATIIAVLSLIAVFLYKKRKVQRLVCLAVFLLILVFCLLTGYYMVTIDKIQEIGQNAVINPSIWVAFPVIACILSILAINSINADEKLIRSLDRIR